MQRLDLATASAAEMHLLLSGLLDRANQRVAAAGVMQPMSPPSLATGGPGSAASVSSMMQLGNVASLQLLPSGGYAFPQLAGSHGTPFGMQAAQPLWQPPSAAPGQSSSTLNPGLSPLAMLGSGGGFTYLSNGQLGSSEAFLGSLQQAHSAGGGALRTNPFLRAGSSQLPPAKSVPAPQGAGADPSRLVMAGAQGQGGNMQQMQQQLQQLHPQQLQQLQSLLLANNNNNNNNNNGHNGGGLHFPQAPPLMNAMASMNNKRSAADMESQGRGGAGAGAAAGQRSTPHASEEKKVKVKPPAAARPMPTPPPAAPPAAAAAGGSASAPSGGERSWRSKYSEISRLEDEVKAKKAQIAALQEEGRQLLRKERLLKLQVSNSERTAICYNTDAAQVRGDGGGTCFVII